MKKIFILFLMLFSSLTFAQQGIISFKGSIVAATLNIEIENEKIKPNSLSHLYSVKELPIDLKHKVLIIEYF